MDGVGRWLMISVKGEESEEERDGSTCASRSDGGRGRTTRVRRAGHPLAGVVSDCRCR